MIGRGVPPVREDVADLEPYRSPQRPARVRMNTNESPYEPPRIVLDAVLRTVEEISLNRYPDHSAAELYEALARWTTVAGDRLWVANGSNEVFLHLFLAFGGPGRSVVTFEPSYSMHTKIARMTGTTAIHARRGPDWDVSTDVLEEALQERPDICLFCSPNNPTGNLQDLLGVERALEEIPLVVVDEAYIEFSGTEGAVDLLANHRNLVIVRTLSKAWRLAGGRIGYALGDPEVVNELRRVALPYGLSSLTQAMGTAVLSRAEAGLEHVDAIVNQRQRLVEGMVALGLDPWPSAANFILVALPDRSRPDPAVAGRVWEGLLEAGVLVRDYRTEPSLAGHLRVTAGAPADTDAFLAALKEVLGG